MINLNRDHFYDRIYACFLGKSIGGTIGTPYEGTRALLDVQGFTSPPGRPLPNDDLDLQIVWLRAMEEHGVRAVTPQLLGEYWLSYIPPHWNEYGIGKTNMRAGIAAPLSGDHENVWRHSNGGWIRSEIWACCAPACPALAARHACFDAGVDHGTGEGTYAEIFTAALQSAAFIEHDVQRLLDIALSYIPADSRVARSIGIVRDGYARGLTWQETRALILSDSEDLGWFQAPANVAYVIIGWLYGAGDFKKSVLIAVNCGDDTDCTGGTVGALLGILGGTAALPADWRAYIGDDIVTMAIDRGSLRGLPDDTPALAARTLALARRMLVEYSCAVSVTDEPDACPADARPAPAAAPYAAGGALQYDFTHTCASVAFPDGLRMTPGQEVRVHITLESRTPEPRTLEVTYMLPDALSLVSSPSAVTLFHRSANTATTTDFTLILRAGDVLPARCRGVVQIVSEGRPTVILLPLLFLGPRAGE